MVGRLIGNYRVLRQIGEGGMGAVFEAVHDQIGRRAAIKLLYPELSSKPEFAQRFFNEARAVNIVQHSGIVGVFEFGQLEDGAAYIVMEYLEGETWAARMRQEGGRLDLQEALRLLRQIASALCAAHSKGIVHRDLKPDNVMIVAEPEAPGGERAKILDFGIAKLAEESRQGVQKHMLRTRSGIAMGTPIYMAPEQARGARDVDAKADVYSLGVMLYECLAARPPFLAESPSEMLAMHMYEPPPPLRGLTSGLPERLMDLCHAMLAKDPAQRPEMCEVVERLEALGAPKATAAMPVFTPPTAAGFLQLRRLISSTLGGAAAERPWSRRPLAWGAGLLFCAGLLLLLTAVFRTAQERGLLIAGVVREAPRAMSPRRAPVPAPPERAEGVRHLWSRRFGGPLSSNVYRVAATADGGAVVVGSFAGSADFGAGALASAGAEDIFVARFSPDGTPLWARRFGGKEADYGLGVAVDGAGAVILAGDFRGEVDFGGGPLKSAGREDIFVLKLDPGGAHVWSKRFGGSREDVPSGVAVDGEGGVVLCGTFQRSVDLGGGPLKSAGREDIFVLKLDPGGRHVWSGRFGGPGADAANGIAVDGRGGMVVVGSFQEEVDFVGRGRGGGPLTSAGGQDAFVVRLGRDGEHLWSLRLGGSGADVANAVTVDGDDGVVVVGDHGSDADLGAGVVSAPGGDQIFVLRLFADGRHRWSRTVGGPANFANGVAVTRGGDVVVVGTFHGTVDFGTGPLASEGGYDAFAAGYGAGGEPLFARRFGGAGFDVATTVAADPAGRVLCAGDFERSVDFGGGPLTSAGNADGFLLKLAP